MLYAAQIAERLQIPTGEVTSRLAVMRGLQQVRPLPELGVNHRGQPVQLWVTVESAWTEDIETGSYL